MSNFNICKSYTVLIIVMVATSLTEVIAVRQAEVLVKESAFISCSSKEVKNIQWHNTPPGKKSSKYVYAGGRLYPPYNTGRFRVDNNSTTNMYTLIITNVMREDAGLYECQDDLLSGVFGSTHLTVLDSNPVCTSNANPNGFAGPNTCNIEQENMTFSCAVSFSGNSPTLKWSTLNSNQSLNSSICESKDNRINCSLSMKADPSFDGSTFFCQTTTSNDARHKCSIEDIRVEYFFGDYEAAEKRVGDNVTCMVASNLQIHYNWTIQQNNEDNIFSANRMIFFQKPGFYKCNVKYKIRNITCYASVVAVKVSNIGYDQDIVTESCSVSREQSKVIAVSIGVSVLLLDLVLVIAFIIHQKRLKGRCVSCLRLPGEAEMKNQTTESLPLVANTTPVVISDSTLANAAKEDIESLLLDRINPDFGLLDVLLRNGALDRKEYLEIKSRPTSDDRNVRLLEIVTGKGKLHEFFEALRDSNQEHLVNYVTANGERSPQCSGAWPLTSKEISILDVNQECLVDKMEVSDDKLVANLYKVGFLTKRQQEHVCELVHRQQKVEALLDLLYRSSLNNYHKMIICLLDTNQPHIASILEGRALLVDVRNKLDGDTEAVDRDEKELVIRMQSLLADTSRPFSGRIEEVLTLFTKTY